jgi:FMN-dependent NADH-azoreductase
MPKILEIMHNIKSMLKKYVDGVRSKKTTSPYAATGAIQIIANTVG